MELHQFGKTPLFAAMHELQKKIGVIGADKSVQGKDKNTGNKYEKYKYTSLDKILETLRPVMNKEHLTIHQPLEYDQAGKPYVHTVIVHTESGEAMSSKTAIQSAEVINANSAQQFGAGVSYYRRYALLAILGLAAGEEDSDAAVLDPELETEAAWCRRVWKALSNAGHKNIAEYGASLPHSKRVDYFKEQLEKNELEVPMEAPELTLDSGEE